MEPTALPPASPRSRPAQVQPPPLGALRPGLLLAAAILAFFAPSAAATQEQESELEGELVDRVVAIVGDSAILLSQVLQRENQERAVGVQVPAPGTPESEDFRSALLEGLIDEMVLLQAAARDTLLTIDDDEVEDSLQKHMDGIEAQYVDRAAMIEALRLEGLTLQNFRELNRIQIAQGKLIRLYVRTRTGEGEVAVEVTDEELRAAFEERQFLQQRPASVTFDQIVLEVKASDSARAEARTLLEGIRERALAGEDFTELARTYSHDPSAQTGGDLGWFRKGRFVEEFEDAAFSLLEGGISDVFETAFGYHIVLVERIRYSERKARHILIRPVAVTADRIRVRELATELAERAKTEDFRELVERYHDSLDPDSGTIAERQIAGSLAAAYLVPLTTGQPGEIAGPIQFTTRSGRDAFAVVRIIERRAAGEYAFEDLEPDLRAMLGEQKRIRAHIDGLRAKTYIEIKQAVDNPSVAPMAARRVLLTLQAREALRPARMHRRPNAAGTCSTACKGT